MSLHAPRKRYSRPVDSEVPETKLCVSCGLTKPSSAFWGNRQRRDGLQNYCADCARELQREERRGPIWRATRGNIAMELHGVLLMHKAALGVMEILLRRMMEKSRK